MIRANGRKITYGIKHFNLDTKNDFSKLNQYVLVPGCTAFVIDTSTKYVLNNKMKWVEVKKYNGSSSGGGNSGDEDYDGGSIDGTDPDNSTNEDGEYDGGSIDGTDPI